MKKIENYLKPEDGKFNLPEKSNFRFYIAMTSMINLTGKKDYQQGDLVDFDMRKLNKKIVNKAVKFILDSASQFLTNQEGTLDSIAKSKPFCDSLLQKIKM